MKRVFIVHGWEGYPQEGWFPWLKDQLERRDISATVLPMPNPAYPKIGEWVGFLNQSLVEVDENTFFVGHSIGCQTIIRYLESLPASNKVGGAIFVAGWTKLHPDATKDQRSAAIARPWLTTLINWEKVRQRTNRFVAIFSDNDGWVYLDDGDEFKQKLGAKVIVEHNKGHYSGEDGISELPVALDELLEMTRS